MKITFLDPQNFDYTVDTPLTSPLGGSQSALCYAAVALAERGHDVIVANRTTMPGRYASVDCVGEAGWAAAVQGRDVVVVLGSNWGRKARELGVRCPLLLWKQDAPDSGNSAFIADKTSWHGFVFVSQWQADGFTRSYHVPRESIRIVGNGIAPPFAAAPILEPWYVSGTAPVLLYSSTPQRGLDVLLDSFPAIREAVPGVSLRIFSSFATYQRQGDRRHGDLIERCRTTEGVQYIGSVGQKQLASEFSHASMMAYPSTFAETFCTSAIEAMASGAEFVASDLGVLGELYREHGHLIAFDADKKRLAAAFAAAVVRVVRESEADPAAARERRLRRIADVRSRFAWPERARQWEVALEALIGQPAPAWSARSRGQDLGHRLRGLIRRRRRA